MEINSIKRAIRSMEKEQKMLLWQKQRTKKTPKRKKREKKMKIQCFQDWCKMSFEIKEKDLVVNETCELDIFGRVIARGFLDHWREFERKKFKTFFAVCPNCGIKIEIKREWGEVVGTERAYFED